MTNNNEKLFWNVFKNIFLLNKIKSFLKIQSSQRYDEIVNVSWMLRSNNHSLLKEKVRLGEYIVFYHYNESLGIKEDEFQHIFNSIKDDTEFYKNLFKNYEKYVIVNIEKKLKWAIKTHCIAAFKVLIEKYYGDFGLDFLKLTNKLIIKTMEFNSIEIFNYIISILLKPTTNTSKEQPQQPQQQQLRHLVVPELSTIKETTIDIILSTPCFEIINKLLKLNMIHHVFKKLIDKFYKVDPFYISLNELVYACKLIFKVRDRGLMISLKYNSEEYINKQEIKKFIIKETYNNDDDLLLQEEVLSILSNQNNDEKEIFIGKLLKLFYSVNQYLGGFYSLFFDTDFSTYNNKDEIVKNSNNNYPLAGFKIGLSFGNSYYCKSSLPHNLKRNKKRIDFEKQFTISDSIDSYSSNNIRVLFIYCKNKEKQKQFIKEMIQFSKESGYISTVLILLLLIEFDDLLLLKFAINQLLVLGDGYQDISFLLNENLELVDTGIQRYINSNEMLSFCFNHFRKHFIINDIYNWYQCGRIDLLVHYEMLLLNSISIKIGDNGNGQQIINQEEIENVAFSKIKDKLPPFPSDNIAFYSRSKPTLVKTIAYIIDKPKIYTFNETTILDCVSLIHNYTNHREEIQHIIENISKSIVYSPLLLFKDPIVFGRISTPWVLFMDWVFNERKQDIKSGRCDFHNALSSKGAYYLALYLTGRVDQLMTEITFIGSKDLFDLFAMVGRKGDIDTFDRLMNAYNQCTTVSTHKLSRDKSEKLNILLKSATEHGRLNIFQHIFKNHKGIFKEKITKNNDDSQEDSLLKSLTQIEILIYELDIIDLFEFILNNLNYPILNNFKKYSKKKGIINHFYKNLIN